MATIIIEPGVILDGGITFEPVGPDPYFRYVTLLLSGNGTDGAQNNTFTDSSSNNFSITRNGNTTQGSFSPYGANWSNYLNGTTDYLTFPSNSAYSFGTGDFTVEAWVHTGAPPGGGSTNDKTVFGGFSAFSPACFFFLVNNSNAPAIWNGTNQFTSSLSVATNTWAHVAWVRSSGTLYIFVNGQIGLTQASFTTSFTSAATAFTGRSDADATRWFPGYISNLRVVKGTALYTSAFTPSTTPLTAIANTSLLTCQSNRFIDNSTNNFAITRSGTPSVQRWSPFSPTAAYSASVTGGSGYFDGSGDYLTSSSTSISFGTNNFTMECWVYPNSSVDQIVFDCRSGSNSNKPTIGVVSLQLAYQTSGTNRILAGSVPINTWSHLAIVRNSNVIYAYVNGVQVGTYSDSSDYGVVTRYQAGADDDGSPNAYFNGYISSMRAVVGTAVYTSNFTPPTVPLTAVTNTSLLLNYTNAGIIDGTMINDLETIGDAQISTSVKKYGSGSLKFDGSGDGLLIPANRNATFGTGDYTIEAWVQLASSATQYYPIVLTLSTADNNASTAFAIGWGDSGYGFQMDVKFGSVGDTFISAYTQTSFLNTWRHIAVCRSGTTARVFVDGVQAASVTDSYNYSGAYRIRCGYNVNEYGSFYLNGYIDDLRITRGYARYTSNFTPPDDLLNR